MGLVSAAADKPSVSAGAPADSTVPAAPTAAAPAAAKGAKRVMPKEDVIPPFELPEGVEVLARDESGRTWRMNGRLKEGLAEGKKSLYIALFKATYDFKHETAMNEAKTHFLSTWVKGREVLLLMVWAGNGYTYFSWGTYSE